MHHYRKFLNRLGVLVGTAMLLALISLPAQAQAPVMNVITTWRPGTQLTSIPSDDRFVDLEIAVSGNVQFWAVNLSCTIGTGTQFSNPVVIVGPAWGTTNEFTRFPPDANTLTGSTFNITISRVGITTAPIGTNGVSSTTSLLTLRLKVNNLTANATVSVTCRTMEFLNRDGVVLVRGRQARSTPLQILRGYTLSGTALLQGARSHAGINVSCDLEGPTPAITTTTASNGAFTFGGAGSLLRDFGVYLCTFSTTQASYLDSVVRLNLQTPTYRLLPVLLRGGDINPPPDNTINMIDAGIITANWNTSVPAFTGGDLNGDARVNQSDLAILTGNVNLAGPLNTAHIVYGLATDLGGTFPNSKLRWGDVLNNLLSNTTTLMGNSRTRDFWPDVSPDGSKVAFIGVDTRGKHALYIRDVATNRDTRVTPANYALEAFAPSWSPDGSKIAFVCSFYEESTGGYKVDEGSLCVVDSTDTTGTSIQTLAPDTRIQKPAWYDNDKLFYACGSTLCAYGFSGGYSIVTGLGAGYDMPAVGAAGGAEYLFYRHYNSGTGVTSIRYRQVTNLQITVSSSNVQFGSEQLVSATGQTDSVDYYALSPNMDILFYELNSDIFQVLDNGGGDGPPVYSPFATSMILAGYTGNPTWIGFTPPAAPDVLFESDLFPYRATFDWAP